MKRMEIPNDVLHILNTLQQHGFTALLAGGCVRDFLMGKTPKDFDIATSAAPCDIKNLFQKTTDVGKNFGVTVVIQNDRQYEIAAFRSETAYSDGRHPDHIEFTTPEIDAQRRDFTINALFYDHNQQRVIDYVNGEEDIKMRIVRTVGDPEARFHEDHLRLIRAIRFAARTGFSIEQNTWNAIQQLAGLIRTVSAERIASEYDKILLCDNKSLAVELLAQSGLLRHTLPEVDMLRGMPQPKQFHPEGDVFIHTTLMLQHFENIQSEDDFLSLTQNCAEEHILVLLWAALLHDVGKPHTLEVDTRIRFNKHDQVGADIAEQILIRLKRSNTLLETVTELVRSHMKIPTLNEMRISKKRRLLQDPLFPLHLLLHKLDCLASHNILDAYQYAYHAWTEEAERKQEPEKILYGKHLIQLGYSPGPQFTQILNAAQDAYLEGTINDIDSAKQWVLSVFPIK